MLDEGVLPLPYEISDEANRLKIKRIYLDWEGGSDEGYLNVNTDPSPHDSAIKPQKKKRLQALCDDIEEWAGEAWQYSGAGDGTGYGDSLVYDLENETVEVSEWFMERKECALQNEKLRVSKNKL